MLKYVKIAKNLRYYKSDIDVTDLLQKLSIVIHHLK